MGDAARDHTHDSFISRNDHNKTAMKDNFTEREKRCLFRTWLTPYDERVTNRPSTARRREVMPGGVAATRRSIRRSGGFVGIAVAFCLWLFGVIAGALVSGPIGGALSFMFMVIAMPVMPIFGMPASGGSSRIYAAIAISAIIWWFLGQVVAARVSRRPVVGWKEWLREFSILGMGLWIGAAGGLIIGALALGAF
jgi:hypothetical protein